MVAKTFIRGHKAFYDEKSGKWKFYEQSKNTENEVCPRCCQPHIQTDCDYCMKPLRDCNYITSACCGHGVQNGYIVLQDGRIFEEVKLNDR